MPLKVSYECKKLLEMTFHITIENIFPIKNRGVIVVGQFDDGVLRKGDTVRLTSIDGSSFIVEVAGIDVWRNEVNQKMIGIYLTNVAPEKVRAGMTVTLDSN
jgi:translation elongation factor EF-Tu-like GTPase